MIDAVEGLLERIEEDEMLVLAGGVVLRLEVPATTANALKHRVGERVRVLTRLTFNMNDGQFLLFGFATEEERDCFAIFTGISGIGPRKGLMILSQVEVAAFAQAIVQNDVGYLGRIKGIGKKTAERLVVELREKMVPYVGVARTDGGAATALPAEGPVREAVEALIVLGCRPAVAEKAVGEAVKELGEGAATEDLVRAGLRHR